MPNSSAESMGGVTGPLLVVALAFVAFAGIVPAFFIADLVTEQPSDAAKQQAAKTLTALWLGPMAFGLISVVATKLWRRSTAAGPTTRTSSLSLRTALLVIVPAGILTSTLVPELLGYPTGAVIPIVGFGYGLPFLLMAVPGAVGRYRAGQVDKNSSTRVGESE